MRTFTRRRSELERSGGAVAVAFQDAQVVLPRADFVAVLVGHYAGELMEVVEVVDGPHGEEFGERDRAEGGMDAPAGEVFRLQV